jgi:DNA-binding MarR family transcriptional regulator
LLERSGCVPKSRDESDQRVVNLSLTPGGARVLRKAPQPARGLLPEALARVGAADRARLNGGLQALLNVIEDTDQEAGERPLSFTP